jgi:hypothetical protein
MKKLQIIPTKIIGSVYDEDRYVYTSGAAIHTAIDVTTWNEDIGGAYAKLYERIG